MPEWLRRNERNRSIHFLFERASCVTRVTSPVRYAFRFGLGYSSPSYRKKTIALSTKFYEEGPPVPFAEAIDFRTGQTIPSRVLHNCISSGFSDRLRFYFVLRLSQIPATLLPILLRFSTRLPFPVSFHPTGKLPSIRARLKCQLRLRARTLCGTTRRDTDGRG